MSDFLTWWIIFCIRYSRILWIYYKKHETLTDNPSKRIYVNRIENRVTFKIKTEYYLKILTPETMILLGSTKNKDRDKNGENVSHFGITEVI